MALSLEEYKAEPSLTAIAALYGNKHTYSWCCVGVKRFKTETTRNAPFLECWTNSEQLQSSMRVQLMCVIFFLT